MASSTPSEYSKGPPKRDPLLKCTTTADSNKTLKTQYMSLKAMRALLDDIGFNMGLFIKTV